MINKELLSIMLGKDITNISEPVVAENNIAYTCTDNSGWDIINIYELAHKCKEWAYKKGYLLKADLSVCEIYPIENGFVLRLLYYIPIIDEDSEGNTDYPDTEPEAIFKACEYIYANLLKD